MSNPAQNTKVERIAEAIEGLVVASLAGVGQRILEAQTKTPAEKFDDVALAREELSHALREFLQPTLRVVSPE